MKALVVRVHKARILIKGEIFSSMGRGIVVFVGIDKKDTDLSLTKMAEKIVNLRIFEGDNGKMQFSVKDKEYSIMCISNFTLCSNTSKGRRPSFEDVCPLPSAREMFDNFVMLLRSKGVEVKEGKFREHMDIEVEMDGPVNIVINI